MSNPNHISTYNNPMLAVYRNNRLVMVIATGDIEGASPVFQFVDDEGKTAWDSCQHFRITDRNVLPPAADTLRIAYSNLPALTTSR